MFILLNVYYVVSNVSQVIIMSNLLFFSAKFEFQCHIKQLSLRCHVWWHCCFFNFAANECHRRFLICAMRLSRDKASALCSFSQRKCLLFLFCFFKYFFLIEPHFMNGSIHKTTQCFFSTQTGQNWTGGQKNDCNETTAGNTRKK